MEVIYEGILIYNEDEQCWESLKEEDFIDYLEIKLNSLKSTRVNGFPNLDL